MNCCAYAAPNPWVLRASLLSLSEIDITHSGKNGDYETPSKASGR
jgi:hypothetical protein